MSPSRYIRRDQRHMKHTLKIQMFVTKRTCRNWHDGSAGD